MRVLGRSTRFASLVGVAAALATVTTGVDSWSDLSEATRACVAAYDDAQGYRKDGDLLKARKALETCAAATCPGIIQSDCTTWLSQVVDSIPSIILEAKVGEDNVFDVSVWMDGARIATKLDGKPIEINPGLHVFVFERQGAPPIEKKAIVAHTKSDLISATWSSAPAPIRPTGTAHLTGPAPAASDSPRPVTWPVYVLGAITVVSFATFAVLGVSGNATKHDLESSCAPHCTDSQVGPVRTRFIAADVAAGVGVLA
ncbi:MAG: hypothetical protein ABSC94_11825, partial [Polyangiaceae bacterium]